MLYLEDDSRDQWPSVARTLASLEPLDMVLWWYPGEDAAEAPGPFAASGSRERLDRPTTHGDVESPFSARVPVDEALLERLELHVDELEDWGVSLALYRPRRSELVAAVIPHEGIILITDEFGSAVAAAGYRVSADQPDWW